MRKLVLDIEVLQEGTKFPSIREADRPVILVTLYDSYTDTYTTLVQKEGLEKRIEQRDDNWRVVYLPSEKELFNLFLELFKYFDPDVVGGWNVFFDLAFLIQRSRRTNYINPDELSPLGRVNVDWNNKEVETAGRHVFDYLRGYRALKHQPSYTLKYIAEVEDVGKKTEKAKDIPELYTSDLDRLVAYNKNDTEIVVKLDEKIGIFTQFDDTRRFAGVNDINTSMLNSMTLDVFSLRVAKLDGIVLPNKAYGEKYNYEGAIVFDPVPGLHKWVATLDMKRYYPSIILTLNLSPETVNNPDKEGFAPKVVKLLIEFRKRIEKQLEKVQPGTEEYDILQRKKMVAKQLVNGFYGYFAYERSRFFNVNVAAKITETARMGLLLVKRVVEEMGFKVVYGDTDSVFVKYPESFTLEQVIEEAKKVQEAINKQLGKFAKDELGAKENYLEIEFEKVFSPLLLFDVKKRYAGRVVYEKGKSTDYIKVVGFDTIRTDTPPALREVQKNLFGLILRGATRDAVKNYIRGIIHKIEKCEYSIEELGIPQGINKPVAAYGVSSGGRQLHLPQHIRAVVWSNKHLGTRFDRGDKVKILFVRKVKGYPRTDVIAFTDDIANKLPEVVIDTKKYVDWLRSKTEKILQTVGITWYEIEGGKTLWEILQ